MRSKPRVYNLSWYVAPRPCEPRFAPLPRYNTATISLQNPLGAVILYPALATPEILVGDEDKLEILLLSPGWTNKVQMRVRNHLKVSLGLDAAKSSPGRALFVDADGKLVTAEDWKIEAIPFSPKELISTFSGRFSGYVDKRAYQLFSDAGYKTLFRIAISSKCLEAALGSSSVSSCGEPQDRIINEVLKNRNLWAKQENDKYYCFKTGSSDVDFTKFDRSDPIQSYHPVYHYGEHDLKYANLAHLSDVHMAARQQVLAKTHARVIDYAENGSDAALSSSPRIGKLVNVCSKDMLEILNKLGSSDADMLLVGGDLVDFLRSCHLSETIAPKVEGGKPSDVWKAVGLGDDYTENYKDCPDMIAFFGILVNFCRSTAKPAYAISGNHDCYHLPYGLSPRINPEIATRIRALPPEPLTPEEELWENRANEGIPSDHNLTFYEAILAFGETYRELKSGLGSPFEPKMFDWFYAVFTPFTDYSVELPKQHLVAFGWGDHEDLLDTPKTGHGFGHLPRSDDAISDDQLALLETAIGKKKKVILLTHFTFVSYGDSIPVSGGDSDPGRVYFSVKNFDEHNFGTFEKNREILFEKHCGQNRDIQIILTGHSHRRALYLVDSIDYGGRNSVRTRHFDFGAFSLANATYPQMIEPAIIVSDSGGTIPRYNRNGEFNGRGSDPPSGTTVLFDSNGALKAISAARADCCRPRLAVALDYLDIQEKKDVVVKFWSYKFRIEDEQMKTLSRLTFEIELNPDVASRGMSVESVEFFLKWSGCATWDKIVLGNSGLNVFTMSGARDVTAFSTYFAVNRGRGSFLAMKFSKPPSMPRYNFDDPWCWEFQVDSETSAEGVLPWPKTEKSYQILRDKHRAEFPNFKWRRENIPGKYA